MASVAWDRSQTGLENFSGGSMTSEKLTIRQISKLAGVSRSTASRVLNEQPGVSPEVRERVLQVILEHDYQPDPAARSLASRRGGIMVAGQEAEDSGSDDKA
jgi:transcriptional regulator with XRE-family HTH domain